MLDDRDWPSPLVTENAVLLLGYIAGRIHSPSYGVVDADPENGRQIIEHRVSGNRYRVSVEQISGTAYGRVGGSV